MPLHDLQIEQISEALQGRSLDLIVTGSIGAVESVRLVRALRRLGADVHVWLSAGGAQFITPLALEWASANPVRTDFIGTESHLAERDACVVAPASANFLRKLAQGITDSPTSALAASYLGAKRPVLVLPNMHQSLADAPAIAKNLETVASWATILKAREEEHKQKFPDPRELANTIAHNINRKNVSVMIAYGGTKAALDDVRYLGNYSTGALGSLVCDEAFRYGYQVHALQGTCEISSQSYTSLQVTDTHASLNKAANELSERGVDAIIFMSAVLDYLPKEKSSGKIKSGKTDVSIELVPAAKILPALKAKSGVKVGFKLESSVDEWSAVKIAKEYFEKNGLSLIVVNQLSDVSAKKHAAWLIKANHTHKRVEGKAEVAKAIVQHLRENT